MFMVQNKNLFLTNNENHYLDTRKRNNLYLPQANLTIYQKGAYYSGIKFVNNLPLEIKNIADNQNKFKIVLKKFLHSFYTVEEYLSQSWMRSISQDNTILVCWFKGSVYEQYVTTSWIISISQDATILVRWFKEFVYEHYVSTP